MRTSPRGGRISVRVRSPFPLVVLVLFLAVVCVGPSASAQIAANWLDPVSGQWTDPTKWSTDPQYPNNGSVTFDVTIAATGSPYTVMFDDPAAAVTVNTLDLRSPDLTFHQTAGNLTLGTSTVGSGAVPLRIGDRAFYRLSGGTLNLPTNHLSYIGSGGRGWLLQQRGTVVQRGHIAVGIGGGSLGSGVGSLTIYSGQWLGNPNNTADTHIGIGIGPEGTGTMEFRDRGDLTFSVISVGAALGHGTLLVDTSSSDMQLTANRLNIGSGPWGIDGSGTSGFGVATLSSGRITVTGVSIPGILHIGGGTNGLGSGRLAVHGGSLETQATIITPTGMLDVRGGRLALGSTLTAVGIAGSVLLGGTGSVTIHTLNLTQGGRLEVSGGSFTASQLTASDGTQTIIATGGALSIGSFTQLSGTSMFEGNSVLTSNRIVIGGSAEFNVSGGTVNTPLLTMSGGNADFSGGALNVSALQITGGHFTLAPGSDVRLDVNSLEVAGSGILDLADNRLSIDYPGPSPIDQMAEDIARAYSGGAWTGTGITSSLANANTHGLGYGDFANTSIIVRLTRYGDANLDGVVNLTDFNALAYHFGMTGARWDQGDFNYDRIVSLQDFNRLAANFGLAASPNGPTPQDWAVLASVVPEPGLLLFGGVVHLATAFRPRRRCHEK